MSLVKFFCFFNAPYMYVSLLLNTYDQSTRKSSKQYPTNNQYRSNVLIIITMYLIMMLNNVIILLYSCQLPDGEVLIFAGNVRLGSIIDSLILYSQTDVLVPRDTTIFVYTNVLA
jgi:hypothetical protein